MAKQKKDTKNSAQLISLGWDLKSTGDRYNVLGRSAVRRASDNLLLLSLPRVPTGNFAIDKLSGGGLPIWGTTCYYGPESGGKTTAAFEAVAASQRFCFKCLVPTFACSCKKPKLLDAMWQNLEGDLDLDWGRHLGVDLDRLYIASPDSGEEASLMAKSAIGATDCGMLVIDSMAMLYPEAELDDEATIYSQQPGRQAELVKRFVLRLRREVLQVQQRDKPILVLLTNQVRMMINLMFGNPETTTGGNALRHALTLLVRFSQESLAKGEKELYIKDGLTNLTKHVIRRKKAKIQTFSDQEAFSRAVYPIPELNLQKGQLHDLKKIVKLANGLGIIKKTGTGYKLFDVTKIKKQDQLYMLFRRYPEYYYRTQLAILEIIKDQQDKNNADSAMPDLPKGIFPNPKRTTKTEGS